MAITFKELKQYISRVVRISICFLDGHYDNYTLVSDIPDGKYDNLYIYGIGMIDVEFSLDVYTKPQGEMPEYISSKDYFSGCGLEIVVQEEPRDIERHDDQRLCFGDLREYLQIFGNFSVVRKEDWSSEEYELKKDIPKGYDSLYVYGIGLENNPKVIHDPQYEGVEDSYLTKQMVIILSDIPRDDIVGDEELSSYGKGPFFLLINAEEWNHDADEWLGIYTSKKDAREAYDRAVVWYEEERKLSGYTTAQKVTMVEYIPEEDKFRTVERNELD